MCRIILLFIYITTFISTTVPVAAQDKYDYNWLLGYGPSNPANFFGGSHISFSEGNPSITYFPLAGNVQLEVPCSISDKDGHLQFYTSGCTIRNAGHQVMENGDNINEGVYHNYSCGNTTGDGYMNHNGMTSIPVPGHEGQYYIFHIRFRNIDLLTETANDFLYTRVDMNENNGLGKVVEKNQILQWMDTLAPTVSAVRHGNGRDWWIMTENAFKSEFYRYLVDPSGIHGPYKQTVANGWIDGHYLVLQNHYSNDGTKVVQASGDAPAAFVLYDFDRCSGEISNPLRINIPEDTVTYPVWFCFSPNSRYLYATNGALKLYQFDLQAADIEASKQLVGEFDDFRSPHGLPTNFYHLALGPDQRIYMGSPNTVNFLHTINKPDLPGLACDFRQHNVVLITNNIFHLPNNPNFRLYQQEGSGCDSLAIEIPLVAQWRDEQDSLLGKFTVGFTEYSYHQPVSWFWDFGDGTMDTVQNPVHTYPAHGDYTVCLVACNALGVCDTLCRTVTVLEKLTNTLPELVQQGDILVYPNPAHDLLTIQFLENPTQDIEQITIIDALGRAVLQQNIPQGQSIIQLDIRKLTAGPYYLTVPNKGYMGRFLVH